MPRGSCVAFVAACSIASCGAGAEPWRLGDAVDLPNWLSVSGSYRIRYEFLDDSFRIVSDNSDQLLVERLLLDVEGKWSNLRAGVEIQDARAQLSDSRTPLGTDDVNALEPLQLYAGLGLADVLSAGDRLELRAGRMTIDAGARRLVARNRFRNTLNAFTGLHAEWTGGGGSRVKAFVGWPVHRLPDAPRRLEDNDVELDDESAGVRFWGLLAAREKVIGGADAEVFIFGLDEDDATGRPTRNSDLLTPGFRLYASPSSNAWDFELEAALQTGTSRATILPGDTADLDHRAGFIHLHVGRSFDGRWLPRVMLMYDYASGDDAPDDDENNRFDTLYGARRGDFGPTGIYGAFARANIRSPGLRLDLKPGEHWDLLAAYRAMFLASRTDALTTSGLRDPTGASGDFVGHQLEVLYRHFVLRGNVEIQLGGAWLVDGGFLEDAPAAPANGDSLYLFGQAAVTF